MIKYQANVVAVGAGVQEFLDAGVIVLFGQQAPGELAEFAILHDGAQLLAPIAAGDVVSFDSSSYRVLAVGDVASQNLANLGHLVLKCNGLDEPEMPGDVCVEAKPLPRIGRGTRLRIDS
jgi:glucitol/sorbitol PTS system EIIA component